MIYPRVGGKISAINRQNIPDFFPALRHAQWPPGQRHAAEPAIIT
jgi:hypothetical protein